MYFSWIDITYTGYGGPQYHKKCYLKNETANGISNEEGIMSGAKGCISFQGESKIKMKNVVESLAISGKYQKYTICY